MQALSMPHDSHKRTDLTTAIYFALGGLLLLLVGLGIAAYLGGSGEPPMMYEGFN